MLTLLNQCSITMTRPTKVSRINLLWKICAKGANFDATVCISIDFHTVIAYISIKYSKQASPVQFYYDSIAVMTWLNQCWIRKTSDDISNQSLLRNQYFNKECRFKCNDDMNNKMNTIHFLWWTSMIKVYWLVETIILKSHPKQS